MRKLSTARPYIGKQRGRWTLIADARHVRTHLRTIGYEFEPGWKILIKFHPNNKDYKIKEALAFKGGADHKIVKRFFALDCG